jgi:hypothetical protein
MRHPTPSRSITSRNRASFAPQVLRHQTNQKLDMRIEIKARDEVIGGEKPCAGPPDKPARALTRKIAFSLTPRLGRTDAKDSRGAIRIDPVV